MVNDLLKSLISGSLFVFSTSTCISIISQFSQKGYYCLRFVVYYFRRALPNENYGFADLVAIIIEP
jgi:hypothetical protein